MVVAIIAALSVMVLPSIQPTLRDDQRGWQNLRNFIEKQRTIALREGQAYRLQIDLQEGKVTAFPAGLEPRDMKFKQDSKIVTEKFDFLEQSKLSLPEAGSDIILGPEGTITPFRLNLEDDAALVYDGTFLPGKVMKAAPDA